MSTHNIYFYGEITKMIPRLLSNTFLTCFSEVVVWKMVELQGKWLKYGKCYKFMAKKSNRWKKESLS